MDDIKTGVYPVFREWSVEATHLLTTRCPVFRRRESNSGFRMELENLVGIVKGKRHKRENREAESTNVPIRGGLPRSSNEAG